MGTEFTDAINMIREMKRADEEKSIDCIRTVEYIRPEILTFAQEMENTMRKHDPIKGDSWKTCDIDFLHSKMIEEMIEFFKDPHGENALAELVDISNISAMLHSRIKAGDA